MFKKISILTAAGAFIFALGMPVDASAATAEQFNHPSAQHVREALALGNGTDIYVYSDGQTVYLEGPARGAAAYDSIVSRAEKASGGLRVDHSGLYYGT